MTAEEVVLLDESGRPCGRIAKSAVHHDRTPLHLAFSCWLLDDTGRTLLTRRSLAKRTWPGAWTNAFCGHPAPGEPLEGAVHRRAWDELGVHIAAVRLVLPDFRYRAAMTDGTVENEVCPVYTARATDRPVRTRRRWRTCAGSPSPTCRGSSRRRRTPFSPWMQLQLPLLAGDLQR